MIASLVLTCSSIAARTRPIGQSDRAAAGSVTPGDWFSDCIDAAYKQKTAYEILRSDWSSDVCSSDPQRCNHEIADERCALLKGGIPRSGLDLVVGHKPSTRSCSSWLTFN